MRPQTPEEREAARVENARRLARDMAFAEAFHNLMRAVAVVLLILVLTGHLGR